MDSELHDFRRTTRSALAEIPARLGQLRVSTLPGIHLPPVTTPLTPRVLARDTMMLLTPTNVNIPASYMTPSPSPDELVIQQRGRRCVPVTWSPEDYKRNTPMHSDQLTPQKSPPKNTSLRSTPRKRLMLLDFKQLELTPEKINRLEKLSPLKRSPIKHSPINKRAKLDLSTPNNYSGTVQSALKGLSQFQLVDLIQRIIVKHPEIETEVRDNIPAPDIKPLEEKLNYLKRNIFKSLPSSRLGSRTDSSAYSRASTHVQAFRKCILDQGRQLVDSQHWNSVLDYTILAWSYVKATPLWDNHAHNAARRQCFKGLASYCMLALTKGTFDESRCSELFDRMQFMMADSEDMQTCLRKLELATSKC